MVDTVFYLQSLYVGTATTIFSLDSGIVQLHEEQFKSKVLFPLLLMVSY